ncbi:CRP-like cAMP-binding protein [Tibeticola sediminis]|jgi:CRP-like cAMP-binding protein|uniref:CRP-like cAMP-binding protein n=2 Tax=Tibeticola sediminis TaxID=1917811 RepID=A0A3N4U2H4_9BURK|nr:Crp/Fnr family transcriptional regulator [Tibeticola sp.]MCI4440341.1 Crp/Fnr family transcriptional regulator [Tibeticola sp.]RPE65043.1 CRP-like cAMP-binding protein [Tibeticola sediminis]
MFALMSLESSGLAQSLPPGQVVLRRQQPLAEVTYLESGRVALGLLDGSEMPHVLGAVQGPFWLDASSAVLGLPNLVDAVAESELVIRRVPLAAFLRATATLPDAAQTVLRDIARAHRQQTEMAVSRLVKDAEARCAEWLLRHAEPLPESGGLAVLLRERKRQIAQQLGIAPETFSRVLRHLRERSLISGSGRVLNLVDPSGLRSLAGV